MHTTEETTSLSTGVVSIGSGLTAKFLVIVISLHSLQFARTSEHLLAALLF